MWGHTEYILQSFLWQMTQCSKRALARFFLLDTLSFFRVTTLILWCAYWFTFKKEHKVQRKAKRLLPYMQKWSYILTQCLSRHSKCSYHFKALKGLQNKKVIFSQKTKMFKTSVVTDKISVCNCNSWNLN